MAIPAGWTATNGSVTTDGKLCAGNITAALRAQYDALVSTSTCVERLHAVGRDFDKASGLQRPEHRAGPALAKFNNQSAWLLSKSTDVLVKILNVSRVEARECRKMTLKQQRIEHGRAKQAQRDAELKSKRARREAKAAENCRLTSIELACKYSQLTKLAIPELQDQLKAWKLKGSKGFTVTQKDREAYVLQLQALIFDEYGASSNDLADVVTQALVPRVLFE